MTSALDHRRLALRLLTVPAAAAAVLALATPAVADASVTAPSTTVVIAGVFGGGGNSGSYYANDFVELFNPSSVPQSLSGLSLQYAPASTGTVDSTKTTALDAVTLPPGGYFLFEGNANGSSKSSNVALSPAPDQVDNNYAIGSTDATIFLVNGTTTITSATSPAVVDEVGFGNTSGNMTTDYLGSPGASLTNTTGLFRNANGCTNTNNNFNDFSVDNANTTAPALPILDTTSTPAPCLTAPTPTLPESPLTVALPATAGVVLIGGLALRRRRAR